jgi:hypothetical protein
MSGLSTFSTYGVSSYLAFLPIRSNSATTKIFPYGSSKPIPLIGKTKMNATVNSETCAIEFHVIAGNGKPYLCSNCFFILNGILRAVCATGFMDSST